MMHNPLAISLGCGPAMLVIAFVHATAGVGAAQTMCPPRDTGQEIKSIRITEGDLDRHTGRPLGPTRLQSEITVSEDRRTITVVQFQADTLTQAKRKMFPRTTIDYDSAGRMIRGVTRMDGRTETGRTECEYDELGRLRKATRTSANPEFNVAQVIEHGPSWQRVRQTTPTRSVATLMELDSSNRVVKAVERNESTGVVDMVTEYSYAPRSIEKCLSDPTGERTCTVTRMDERGNVVEVKSAESSRSETYEYDSRGNWISRRTVSTGYLSGTGPNLVTFRDIIYWP